MRKSVLAGLACVALSLVARAAVAQSASDPCFAGAAFGADVRVADCTKWIESGRLSPGNLGVAYFNRGIAYEDAHDPAHAIADYDQAIRIEASAGRYKNRGNAYEDSGDFDRAVADFSQAIRLNPQDAGAWYDRGNAYQDKGDYDRAIADYDQALRVDPQHVSVYMNRGNAWARKQDWDRAIADYDQAIRVDPNGDAAYANRGYAYLQKLDFDHAVADYDQALRVDPRNALALFNRGVTYEAKGDFDHAIADADAYLRLAPAAADGPPFRARLIAERDAAAAKAGDRFAIRLADGDGDADAAGPPPAPGDLRTPMQDAAGGPAFLWLKPEVIVGADMLEDAGVSRDDYGRSSVGVRLTAEGARRLADATQANLGKKMAIVVDGKIVTAATIMGPITGGVLEITGAFTPDQATALAHAIAGKIEK